MLNEADGVEDEDQSTYPCSVQEAGWNVSREVKNECDPDKGSVHCGREEAMCSGWQTSRASMWKISSSEEIQQKWKNGER